MKETHYKLKHRVTALFAAAVMLCSMLPGAAFAEEPTPQPTEETAQMEQQTEPSETDNGQTDESSPDPGEDVTEATPETAEEQPAEEEISAAVVGAELYTDLPDAPIGSYIGSEGLPVATGETKIGISEWPESQLEEGGSYLTAVALDNDGLTMAAPLLDGADYAIVPIMAQVEYPADGSSTDMILPDGVTLLDFYGEPATDADIQSLGEQLKPVAMLSMLEYINTAVMSNERNDPKAATWVYFDEIYLLLRDSLSANFLYTSWKRFRKYNAYATGITQNVQDCLTNDTAYAMLANSEFVVMLRQTKDIDSVVELYGLSEPQRKYLLLAQPGEGIIKMGNSLIPFNNPQPKDTKTYKLLTTKPGEME